MLQNADNHCIYPTKCMQLKKHLATIQSWCRVTWRGDVVVRASDMQLIGRRFASRPLRFTYNPGQVVHAHVPLFTKHIGTGVSWELNRHSMRHTSTVSVDLKLRLVSG